MSKTKTKRARREAKREQQKKVAKALNTTVPSSSTTFTNTTTTTTMPHPQPSTLNPRKRPSKIPFTTYANILLVGEGDFSFTHSLVLAHGCANVTATSFDTRDEVMQKYPDTFPKIEEELRGLVPPVPMVFGVDARKVGGKQTRKGNGKGKGKGRASWDIISFMFPHTGGLSTDVNRQVRANQALLVSFFESCLGKNNPKTPKPSKPKASSADSAAEAPFLHPTHGKIIVTLFDSHPYTLWNIRDLARHAGLRVIESFAFDWEAYPGYRHVRTLGQLEGGGGWKGEERSARMYVFGVKGEGNGEEQGRGKRKRKRGVGGESSDDEGDAED
ncbi:uncharacterized protein EI97DRAFT_382671 [Westerdykella ornata]|uniref:25S rRNA (uridine-N(3))-methyltransferase BMT5-like domain-containing protein n=1 Tax=Westerdykella ornata TaxID=318751 RepID=A0A6A6JBG8_WESOR|nr:uncharacterized protein EI97DRAFT_382671 [Westerdykella ornata]KAF2273772.1 hypothetical protein EI97DRAFT_382671 [Westerdykella ornata]